MLKLLNMSLLSVLLLSTSQVYAGGEVDAEASTNEEEPRMLAEDRGALLDKCFDDKNGQACYDYGMEISKDSINLKYYRLALRRACDLKHVESCSQIIKDDKEGDEIRQKCETGNAESCAHYSIGRQLMYDDVIGSIHYAKKACKLGEKRSCEQLKIEEDKVNDGYIK